VLIISGRGTRTSAALVDGFIRFNGDTGSNYSKTHLYGTGSAAGSDNASNTTSAPAGTWYPTAISSSGIYGTTVISIMNYSNTTTYKTALSRNASISTTNALPGAIVSLWRNTAAITSIDLFMNPNDWATGSTFTLYGIAAA
jgi:hypothetical protein